MRKKSEKLRRKKKSKKRRKKINIKTILTETLKLIKTLTKKRRKMKTLKVETTVKSNLLRVNHKKESVKILLNFKIYNILIGKMAVVLN